MLVEECPAPHEIMAEDSPAPQCIVLEESPVPMNGIKDRPCLVVESPEPTKDWSGARSPVPMSGTKDCPSPLDDSPAVSKVNNLGWGEGNPVKRGSATLPINLVSAPSTTSPMEDPQPQLPPNLGGDPGVATGLQPVFASHQRIQSPTVVHESGQHIVVDESPPPPPQPNPVGPISPPPSARPCQGAYIKHVDGIPYLVRPSRAEGSGGDISLVGGRLHLLLRAPHPRFALRRGPLVPLLPRGLLLEAVAGYLLLLGVDVPRFDILGAPLKRGVRMT